MKSKNERIQEAAKRKEAYDKLTPQQKLDKLKDGGYTAAKERKRIEHQILKRKI